MDYAVCAPPLDDRSFWNRAIIWEMPEFLHTYTLHDSNLLYATLNVWSGLVVVIQWDLHWNRNIPDGYDNLAIAFSVPYSVNWDAGNLRLGTLAGAESREVSQQELQLFLEEDAKSKTYDFQSPPDSSSIGPKSLDQKLTRTIFEGMFNNNLEVLHGADVAFACFNAKFDVFPIPKSKPT